MKIAPNERVRYRNNPLAEVLCQVRFSGLENTEALPIEVMQSAFEGAGYTVKTEEQTLGFVLTGEAGKAPVASQAPASKIHHFSTSDNIWRFSIHHDFLTLTCTKYQSWEEFLPRMIAGSEILTAHLQEIKPVRLGLRYKDIIEREALGLEGTPWSDLISPFLLGPLTLNALSEEETLDEANIGNFVSQTSLVLDDCKLLLQSSLLTSTDNTRRAFLIDADFFEEPLTNTALLKDKEALKQHLNILHNNAGALFRRGITEKLHGALGPEAI